MRVSQTVLSAAAFAGIAAASPAPVAQQLDLAAVLTAPAVSLTAAPLSLATQVVTINTASLVASIQSQVTSVATASVAPTATAASKKRDLEARDLEKRSSVSSLLSYLSSLFGVKTSGSTTTSSSTTSAASTSSTISVAVLAASTTSTSSAAKTTSTSSVFSSSSFISTTTTIASSGSATTTTSSTTACPTTPENGTYCGFINPEDPCAPQPNGNGPNITQLTGADTVSNFMNYAPFQSMAANAATPAGYVNTFKNLNASSSANSYLGLYTLSSYDTAGCAAYCANTSLCTAFNIYIERDPSQNPTANDSTAATVWGYWCPDPMSITNYKCTLWGSGLDNTTATNAGGWREQFNVVVVGSNGYDASNVTTPVAITNYTAPANCSGGAINAGQYWVGSQFYSGAYNPQLCAAYAQAQTATNRQAAISNGAHSYTPCNMFNAYEVHKNGIAQGTYCSLYDTNVSTSYATVQGTHSGSDYYSCRNSWSYSLQTQDKGTC